MPPTAPNTYLETEVLTATPQKLQLMLIDGAIRFSQRARTLWAEGDDAGAGDCVLRAQEIMGELLQSASGTKSDITEKLSAIYLFVFSQLTEAYLERDAKRIDEVIRVLEVERETWRQVCEKFGARLEITIPDAHLPAAAPIVEVDAPLESGGFSLEA
ncbi:MAG: flagellar export chaperone FliS [Planctomycetales bacterium]|nr:flagellar export chaperone FliS [Planctomycetales bacterium]